jgi:EAL domain-containing protein (putative c-di-GMP-specific phosphodiesterase class I)
MGAYSDVDKTLYIERRFDRAKMVANSVKGNLAKPIGFYDKSMHDAEVLEEQLLDDFPTAIKEKQFVVFYQPKYDVQGDEPVLSSAEALARWNHPKLGMVSPGVFIPLFEKNGLIQALDNYIWSEAASQIREWKKRLHVTIPVSVNVSRIDLFDRELVYKLLDITEKNGLKNEELLLEITESAYSENAGVIIENVKQLRKLGFKIEMDDFGSGYSSLSMLSSLPIDALKLDMQFIRSAFNEHKETRLLEAVISLAHSFDMPTIAEGVETAEQVSALKAMGCDIIQGYYFSRPVSANEFEKFVVEKKESLICS